MLRGVFLGMVFVLLTIWTGYGQEKRNLLEKSLGGQELPEIRSVTYPGYADRSFWGSVPADIKEKAIQKAEKSQKRGVWSVPLTTYLEYVRIGDRKNCDALDGAQRTQLQNLVLGELLEGKGRFIDAIIDQVWMICERSTWVGTAHLASQKQGAGVPDVNDVIIDLHSGEQSTLLAWTYYFFKTEFDRVSPLISKRIEQELETRTFRPYLSRDDLWWMGFKGSFVNNWNVWCNYNVLMSALLAETDPQLKREIVRKTMRSVDHFINYYKDDGGCEEGPSYWGCAPGKMMEYLEALRDATGGKVDIFQEPLIRKMGEYIAKMHIDSMYFINFADAGARNGSVPTVIYRFGKNTQSPELMSFGKYMGDLVGFEKNPLQGAFDQVLNYLLIRNEFAQCEAKAPAYKSVWMDGIQVVVGRERTGSNQGLFFAAKGGYNNESHNHNDVGSFVLYKNGKPVLIDAGVGTYTAKTFSSRRYEIWNMQSAWHNLPLVNGEQQAFGTRYRASDVSFSDQGRRLIFSLNLAAAYPLQAACKSWKRTYTFVRGNYLKVADQYQLAEVKGATALHFLTACKVDASKRGILLLGEGEQQVKMIYDPRQMKLMLEEKVMDDDRMDFWGKKLTRIELNYQVQGRQGESEVIFK